MSRAKIDRLIATAGLVLSIVLLVASISFYFKQGFIHEQVTQQLTSKKIFFPKAGSAEFNALPTSDKQVLLPYEGQQVLTGAQAQIYANSYLAAHLLAIGGGLTYSEVSIESANNPSDTVLAAKADALFKTETQQSMLLTTYAYDTLAAVAVIISYGTLIAAIFLFVVSIIVLSFSRQESGKK